MPNRVRELREARGLSQIALAGAASLTRQSVSAIEAGRAIPGVDVALRIARALDCPVEELFDERSGSDRIRAEPGASHATGRVALAHLGGRWVCHPLHEDGLRISADGIAVASGARHEVEVEPVRPLANARDNVVMMGCAAGLGLLADRLNSRPGAGRFLWFPRSSTAALEALSRGQTHLAGVHLVDGRTGEANTADVRRMSLREPTVLVTLARWEAGLVIRPEDARRIRRVEDLGARGVRLAVREPGAGARRLLEREVRAAGLPATVLRNAQLELKGHLEVARAVAMGVVDSGVATRDAAIAFGLGFVPLAEERYDLALSRSALVDPRVERMLDVLASGPFRRELSSLGYDTRPSGERVAEVRAA